MELKIRDLYSYMLSHTGPGFLLGVEILIYLQLFANIDVSGFISRIWLGNTGGILVFAAIVYIVSTILGIIIDGFHHFFFEIVFCNV